LTHPALPLTAKIFGDKFLWGVATAAAQNEGAWNVDGRGLSIWDVFSRRRGKIKGNAKPYEACDFYHRYKDDLLLVKALGFTVFRFSFSWSRLFPDGSSKVNKKGLAFYHKVIDECLVLGLIPFVTLYHWDLPYELEKQGGWTSHHMNNWFNRYAQFCAEEFGAKVKHWIVLNEPFGFTSLGYLLGKHAPGKTGLQHFFKAVHHAALAQADGGRIIKSVVKKAYVGTSFSCSEIIPFSEKPQDLQAAQRADILFNRLFLEPLLGKGYPAGFQLMEKLEMHNRAWKYTNRLQFDMDFIGLQNYFPLVIKYNPFIPVVQASQVKAVGRNVPHTALGWEVNANSFYHIIKKIWSYGAIKEIIISENGAAYNDKSENGRIQDTDRIQYFKEHIAAMHKAKKEGVNIKGYFAWTLMDNFEWAEGYKARFGLIHVDFNTQLRTIKDSGYWFRDFLQAR
jgi:beta-glucosidase